MAAKLYSAHPTYCGRIAGSQISRIDRSFSPLLQVPSVRSAAAVEVTPLNLDFAATFQSYDWRSFMRLSHLRSNFAHLHLTITLPHQHTLPWSTRKAAL